MSKILFNNQQIQELKQLDIIKNVTSKSITFKPAFKIDVIKHCTTITQAYAFFKNHQVGIDVIGEKRLTESYYRWKYNFEKNSNANFLNENRGRHLNNEDMNMDLLTHTERVKVLKRKLREADEEIKLLKKYIPSWDKLLLTTESKCYAVIAMIQEGHKLNTTRMCSRLKLNRTTLYSYQKSLRNIQAHKLNELYIIKKYSTRHINVLVTGLSK